jgi:hypothetical protein
LFSNKDIQEDQEEVVEEAKQAQDAQTVKKSRKQGLNLAADTSTKQNKR